MTSPKRIGRPPTWPIRDLAVGEAFVRACAPDQRAKTQEQLLAVIGHYRKRGGTAVFATTRRHPGGVRCERIR